MRVLDEVAEAVHLARGWLPQPIVSSTRLEDQFPRPVTRARWQAACDHLGTRLPPVVLDQGHWFLPDEIETIWDMVDLVARHRPGWEPPAERTVAAWRDAQVFIGVRGVLVDTLNAYPKEVVRKARLRTDLGA